MKLHVKEIQVENGVDPNGFLKHAILLPWNVQAAHIYIYIYIHVYIHKHTHTHTHTHTYMRMHI